MATRRPRPATEPNGQPAPTTDARTSSTGAADGGTNPAAFDTAVLLAVPELAAFTSPWRASSYAPDQPDLPIERRFPPHVTVLTPFADADDAAALERLRQVGARHAPLDLLFARAQRFAGGGPVWLRPEPADAVRSLVRDVLETFAELPAYGGLHPDPVPHLTVTTVGDDTVLQQVRHAIDVQGPLTAHVDSLGVWARGADTVWQLAASVPLSGS